MICSLDIVTVGTRCPKSGMLDHAEVDPRRVKHLEAIILSMTPEERRKRQILSGSRRARVARGSGRPVQEVNRMLEQFKKIRKMMKQMSKHAPQMMRGGVPDINRMIG